MLGTVGILVGEDPGACFRQLLKCIFGSLNATSDTVMARRRDWIASSSLSASLGEMGGVAAKSSCEGPFVSNDAFGSS